MWTCQHVVVIIHRSIILRGAKSHSPWFKVSRKQDSTSHNIPLVATRTKRIWIRIYIVGLFEAHCVFSTHLRHHCPWTLFHRQHGRRCWNGKSFSSQEGGKWGDVRQSRFTCPCSILDVCSLDNLSWRAQWQCNNCFQDQQSQFRSSVTWYGFIRTIG